MARAGTGRIGRCRGKSPSTAMPMVWPTRWARTPDPRAEPARKSRKDAHGAAGLTRAAPERPVRTEAHDAEPHGHGRRRRPTPPRRDRQPPGASDRLPPWHLRSAGSPGAGSCTRTWPTTFGWSPWTCAATAGRRSRATGYDDARLWADDVAAVIQGLESRAARALWLVVRALVILDYLRHYGEDAHRRHQLRRRHHEARQRGGDGGPHARVPRPRAGPVCHGRAGERAQPRAVVAPVLRPRARRPRSAT